MGGPGELVAYIAKIQVQFFLSQGIDGGINFHLIHYHLGCISEKYVGKIAMQKKN